MNDLYSVTQSSNSYIYSNYIRNEDTSNVFKFIRQRRYTTRNTTIFVFYDTITFRFCGRVQSSQFLRRVLFVQLRSCCQYSIVHGNMLPLYFDDGVTLRTPEYPSVQTSVVIDPRRSFYWQRFVKVHFSIGKVRLILRWLVSSFLPLSLDSERISVTFHPDGNSNCRSLHSLFPLPRILFPTP